ncbi:MAG: hypothetical protein MJE68_13700 [Proteobacteria bacterium]|nr:hypothetical protein [Pseudomonadota bacterium]
MLVWGQRDAHRFLRGTGFGYGFRHVRIHQDQNQFHLAKQGTLTCTIADMGGLGKFLFGGKKEVV